MSTTASMPASHHGAPFEHLGLVYRRSNQLQAQFALLFQHAIMPLRRRASFLDAGAGDGTLTGTIAQFFERSIAIEPDATRRAALLAIPRRVEACTTTIDAYEPPAGMRFDLVHCSHVLYYLPRESWAGIALKMASWLAPGGVLAIVLQSASGQFQDLFDRYSSLAGQVDPRVLATELRDGGLDVQEVTTTITVSTATLDDLARVASLMLLDGPERLAPVLPGIRSWLHGHCIQRGAGYVLQQPVTMLCARHRDLAV